MTDQFVCANTMPPRVPYAEISALKAVAVNPFAVIEFLRKGYLALLHAHLMSLGGTRQLVGEQVIH